MRIKTQGNTENVVDFGINGTSITIGSAITIDCTAEQTDSRKIIDIVKNDSGELQIGGEGNYVATVSIPPKRYEPAVGEDPPTEIPLNGNEITVTLWNYTN